MRQSFRFGGGVPKQELVIKWDDEGKSPAAASPVHPDDLCPCSKSEGGCIPYTEENGCMCESELHCRSGRAHTPMGDG